MQYLFLFLVEAVKKILDFFDRFRVAQNFATATSTARYVTRSTFLTILAALSVTYFALLIAFTYFMFESITTIYNMVSQLIGMIESGSYSVGQSSGQLDNVMQTFYYFLNASGVATGLNAAFPFIASAVIFRLMKGLKEVFLMLYERFKSTVTDLIMLITAA